MAATLTQSFVRGFTRAIDIFGAKKEWSDIDNSAQRDYEALRSDWESVGGDIRFAIEKYKADAAKA